jgi:hypothetical protein
MKVTKAIFCVDDSFYKEYWPLQAKMCKKILNWDPILFYLCDEDSDFFQDSHGTVKKVKKNSVHSIGIQSCLVRYWSTLFFPTDVCVIGDIDMFMFSPEYFIDKIKEIPEEDFVVLSQDAYNTSSENWKNWGLPYHLDKMFATCYMMGKGRVFSKIMETPAKFEDFLEQISAKYNYENLPWFIDEFYISDCVQNKDHGTKIHYLGDRVLPNGKVDRRIEKWHLPEVTYDVHQMNLDRIRDGCYQTDLLKDGYYIDFHAPRPYLKYKNDIDYICNAIIGESVDYKNIHIESFDPESFKVVFSYTGKGRQDVLAKMTRNEDVLYQTDFSFEPNSGYSFYMSIGYRDDVDTLKVEFKGDDWVETYEFPIKKQKIDLCTEKLQSNRKKIALIGSYCDAPEKEEVLLKNLRKVKRTGIDILVYSPLDLKNPDIAREADYYFKTKENPVLAWPVRAFTMFYEITNKNGKKISLLRDVVNYQWAALYQNKKMAEIALTFDYDTFIHMIYDVNLDDYMMEQLYRDDVNYIHPRRDSQIQSDATLHFMVFDRETMKQIVDDITLQKFLDNNWVAERHALQWVYDHNLTISTYPIKDEVFYWKDYDFYDYSKNSNYKMFWSKNLDADPMMKFVMYNFDESLGIQVKINDKTFNDLENWIYVDTGIRSDEVYLFEVCFAEEKHEYVEEYKSTLRNTIYYS